MKTKLYPIKIICTAFFLLSIFIACEKDNPPPPPPPPPALKAIIENVTQATARKYGVHDDAGHSMDCAKIIANPYMSGEFIAVYHTYINDTAKVNLAVSTDIINWTWIRELAGSNTGSASQPAIAAASDGGFVMAWEQEPNNHLKFVYFTNWNDLQNGMVSKSFDAPKTFSNCAEGTPNIYSASSTQTDAGFHYFSNCDVDRQARGTLTNFNSWTAGKQPAIDNAVLQYGVQGNIGDRDGYLLWQGKNYGILEGQYTKNDFGSWRCFLYDEQTGNADTLNIQTDGGSTAFANPTFTNLQIGGQWVIVVTLFLPSEGIQGSDSAGELIYYSLYQ